MATLSLPTNTPTTDGAVIGCTTDDTTGTAYGMVRDDRQWYFEVSANPLVTQAMIDADKATIIAQDITATELVWAGTDADLATIQLTVDGLAEDAGPFYVGWVQDATVTNFVQSFASDVDGWTFTRAGEQQGINSAGEYITRDENLSVHLNADFSGGVYSNTSGLSKGVVLEPAGENRYDDPMDFNGNWTITGNQTAITDLPAEPSPGGTGCQSLIPQVSTQQHGVSQLQGTTAGRIDSFTLIAKAAGWTTVQMTGGGEYGSTADWCNYNLDTGTIGNNVTTNHKHSIEDLGGGWYRCMFMPTAATTVSGGKIYTNPLPSDMNARRPSNVGDAVNGQLWWLTQNEMGVDFPTSPMLTTRSETSMTRTLSDMGVDDITNDSSWKLTTHPLFDATAIVTDVIILATVGDQTNGIELSVDGSDFTLTKYVSGTGYSATASSAYSYGDRKVITFGISSTTGVNIDVDGTQGNDTNTAPLAVQASTFSLNPGSHAVLSLEEL